MEKSRFLLMKLEGKPIALTISLNKIELNLSEFIFGLNYQCFSEKEKVVIINHESSSYELIDEEDAKKYIREKIPTTFLKQQDREFFSSDFMIPRDNNLEEYFTIMNKNYGFDEITYNFIKLKLQGNPNLDTILEGLGLTELEFLALSLPLNLNSITHLDYYKLLLVNEGFIVDMGFKTENGTSIYTLRDNPLTIIKFKS